MTVESVEFDLVVGSVTTATAARMPLDHVLTS